MYESARESAEAASAYIASDGKAMQAGDPPPIPASCSTHSARHCHSRQAAGLNNAAVKASAKLRANADAELCMELARQEHQIMQITDKQAAAAPLAIANPSSPPLLGLAAVALPALSPVGHAAPPASRVHAARGSMLDRHRSRQCSVPSSAQQCPAGLAVPV